MEKKGHILDTKGIHRALIRIAHEILEKNRGSEGLALVGIRTGGVFLAQRIAGIISEIEKADVPVGIVDITLYRDDLTIGTNQPVLRGTEIPFNVDGGKIVIVDDVLYTGRTVRAAIDAVMEFGRPMMIQLAGPDRQGTQGASNKSRLCWKERLNISQGVCECSFSGKRRG